MLNKIKNFFKKFTEKKRFKKGVKKLDNGFYKEAEEIFLDLRDSWRIERAMIYFNLAGSVIGQDRLEEGEKHLKRAIDLREEYDFLWATLAEVNILQQNWEKAESAIDKALELEPGKKIHEAKKEIICGEQELKENYLKHFSLIKESIEEQKKENWEQCIQLLIKAADYYDRTGYVYNKIGAIYNNNLADSQLAVKYIKKAVQIEPDNEVFSRNLEHVAKNK